MKPSRAADLAANAPLPCQGGACMSIKQQEFIEDRSLGIPGHSGLTRINLEPSRSPSMIAPNTARVHDLRGGGRSDLTDG
ncbi:hypothetical protein NOVOSPHI9U_420201 [Novosphingobium sp. 9U]|nr:hypothetical protein NOVOSPHI9U_420201 [Novosphingobium sp. 9U]